MQTPKIENKVKTHFVSMPNRIRIISNNAMLTTLRQQFLIGFYKDCLEAIQAVELSCSLKILIVPLLDFISLS